MFSEGFLFTRNQRHDFSAFVRPERMTNKEVSTLSSTLNYVGSVSHLTRDFPSLYCFPLGDYLLLLRHYDSGRTHAGRAIGVIEGVAVQRTRARHFALAIPHILAHQNDLLAISDALGDINAAEVGTHMQWKLPDVRAEVPTGDDFVDSFVARQADDRLFVPFNRSGKGMLMAALVDNRFPSLHFAFGTNSDVMAALLDSGIDTDIVSFFNTSKPSFRSRENNQKTDDIAGYTTITEDQRRTTTSIRPTPTTTESIAPRTGQPAPPPSPEPEPQPTPTYTPPPVQPSTGFDDEPDGEPLLTPREMRRLARENLEPEAEVEPEPEVHGTFDAQAAEDDRLLTPREMLQRLREQERAESDSESSDPEVLAWLRRVINRLLGRK